MLDPHRLSVFRSVLASGSLQAAADNLGLTASAVSQHLSVLAKETGLVLFERSGRRIVPTTAARLLAERSTEVLDGMTRLEEAVADLREGRTGRLSVGYFSSAGSTWMPILARTLMTEMPDLTLGLVLTEMGVHGPEPDLDLVVDLPAAPAPLGTRRVDLMDDPFVAVLPPGHRLAERPSVTLADLRTDRWISNDLLRSAGHRIVVGACAAAGFTPRFPVQAQDHHTAIAFVAAGLGISVLPRMGTRYAGPDVVVVPVAGPAPVRRISALVHERVPANRAVTRALEILHSLGERDAARGTG